MQTGPPPASSSSAGPSNANSGPKTLLAQLGRPSTASSEAAEAGEEASLPPAGRFETTVHHEIKELGPHTLVCTVSYRMPGPDGALYDRSFRK